MSPPFFWGRNRGNGTQGPSRRGDTQEIWGAYDTARSWGSVAPTKRGVGRRGGACGRVANFRSTSFIHFTADSPTSGFGSAPPAHASHQVDARRQGQMVTARPHHASQQAGADRLTLLPVPRDVFPTHRPGVGGGPPLSSAWLSSPRSTNDVRLGPLS
jgi:hypothetical protein